MKLNIKALAASLAVGLALVSCNNDFDETDYSPVVPEKAELGIWTRQYTPSGSKPYTVNLTVNAKGDTICDVTYYDAASKMANVYAGGTVSYNKKTGMITANFAEDAEGTPARATITPSNDKSYYIVNLYNVTTSESGDEVLSNIDDFIAVTSDTISVLGRWELADGQTVQLDIDGKAYFVNGDDKLAEGTYTFDGKSGSINIGGQTYAMNFNSTGNGQMSINNAYAGHVMSPLPYDWAEYAIGTYTSGIFGNSFEVTLYYSAARSTYRMNPYASLFGEDGDNAPTAYLFTWTQSTDQITMKTTKNLNLGYSHQTYGPMSLSMPSADDVTSWNSQYPSETVKATSVNGNEFTFCWNVTVSAGSFGLYNDTYELTDFVVDSE